MGPGDYENSIGVGVRTNIAQFETHRQKMIERKCKLVADNAPHNRFDDQKPLKEHTVGFRRINASRKILQGEVGQEERLPEFYYKQKNPGPIQYVEEQGIDCKSSIMVSCKFLSFETKRRNPNFLVPRGR